MVGSFVEFKDPRWGIPKLIMIGCKKGTGKFACCVIVSVLAVPQAEADFGNKLTWSQIQRVFARPVTPP